ncbi:glycosyltransferase family 4 protein [Tsuneonella troitsensis]|uniref:glycosyltransferase family 4 protein n=1 Tax=Tsuneonella troitsensis TaxID=292222 RepID=UPI0007089788|nr:glycosyltransferase family 4 protein [Tsuneonella troitsensis]
MKPGEPASHHSTLPVLVVAPDPASGRARQAGGLVTRSIGLAHYARRRGRRIDWIDTSQNNFPPPSAVVRTGRAVLRIITFAWRTVTRRYAGAIVFGGAGAGFFERSVMVLIGRAAGLRTARFIVDGNMLGFYERHSAIRPIIDRLLRAADIVGLQGDSWRPFYRSAGVPDQRMQVVPNWYLPPHGETSPRSPRSSGPVHFVYVGWLIAEKGIRELLAAARVLAARNADFRLTIVGGGDLLGEAEAATNEPAFRDRVVAPGWLDSERVRVQLAQADVLVHPSYAEGLPNSLLEAMASGLAAIATPVGAIPDVIEEDASGFLVEPRDAASLADAMQRYCDDPSMAFRHGLRGMEIVATRHDLDTNCGLLFGLLDDDKAGR